MARTKPDWCKPTKRQRDEPGRKKREREEKRGSEREEREGSGGGRMPSVTNGGPWGPSSFVREKRDRERGQGKKRREGISVRGCWRAFG